MKEKTWLILSGYDGDYSPAAVVTCTEEKVRGYCESRSFEQKCEAYGSGDGFDEPFPYIKSYRYKEIERISL